MKSTASPAAGVEPSFLSALPKEKKVRKHKARRPVTPTTVAPDKLEQPC